MQYALLRCTEGRVRDNQYDQTATEKLSLSLALSLSLCVCVCVCVPERLRRLDLAGPTPDVCVCVCMCVYVCMYVCLLMLLLKLQINFNVAPRCLSYGPVSRCLPDIAVKWLERRCSTWVGVVSPENRCISHLCWRICLFVCIDAWSFCFAH